MDLSGWASVRHVWGSVLSLQMQEGEEGSRWTLLHRGPLRSSLKHFKIIFGRITLDQRLPGSLQITHVHTSISVRLQYTGTFNNSILYSCKVVWLEVMSWWSPCVTWRPLATEGYLQVNAPDLGELLDYSAPLTPGIWRECLLSVQSIVTT